jgi:hypothetical protein
MMRGLMTAMLAVLLLSGPSGAQMAPGDGYLCYKAALAKGQPKFNSVEKTLEDQFWKSTADVDGFTSLCNPLLPAQHPSVHEVGYRTALAKEKPAQKFVKSTHTAFDQFGSHPLTVVRPLELRAPSAKVLGAGGTPTVNTAGVDHFQCYRATLPKGAPKFAPVPASITDQFGSIDLTLTKISKLCAPVDKAGEDPTAPQHPGHLVCYRAKLAKGIKYSPTTVSVNNTNFGPAVLVAKSVGELCVPAFKDVVPSPTPTAKPTTTPIPTTTPTGTPASTPTPTPIPTPIPTPTPTLVLLPTPAFCDTQNPCPNGFSCDFSRHLCQFTCVSVSCDVDTQICCTGVGGICCDRATQICNDQQTACTTPLCEFGETYIPNSGVCCQNIDICPNQISGATCCTTDETCQLDVSGNGTCVLRN